MGPEEVAIGRRYLPLASRFGFTEYVHASSTAADTLLFEYLPAGEDLQGWRHLASLLLLRVAGTWEEGAAALPRYRDEFLRSVPEVQEVKPVPGRHGGATVVRYRVGAGGEGGHALAAVWQPLPGALGTFQLVQRDESFSERQVAGFEAVIAELVARSEPRGGDRALQAKVATRLWTGACIEHLGDFASQSEFARGRGLRRATGAYTAAVLRGAEGEAWLDSDETGDYVLLLTRPDRCAVWARSASPEVVNAELEALVADLERRGLEVSKQRDREVEGAKGSTRQVAYFAARPGSPAGFVFVASTSASEDVAYQARLTVGRARRP